MSSLKIPLLVVQVLVLLPNSIPVLAVVSGKDMTVGSFSQGRLHGGELSRELNVEGEEKRLGRVGVWLVEYVKC